jgi:adenylate cyclase
MATISIGELVSLELVRTYLEKITGLQGQVFNDAIQPVITVGNPVEFVIPDAKLQNKILTSNAPVPVPGGLATAFRSGNDFVGAAVIYSKDPGQNQAALFLFQWIQSQINSGSQGNDLDFEVSYLKMIIQQFEAITKKLSAAENSKNACEIFISDCHRLFGTPNSAAILIEKGKIDIPNPRKDGLTIMASAGDPFEDFETASYVCYSKKATISNNPKADPMFQRMDDDGNPIIHKAKNVLCLPLFGGDTIIGCIYLWNKETGPFEAKDLALIQALGTTLGGIIANQRLHESLAKNEKIKSNLERYLSPNIVKEIINSGGIPQLGGARVNCTVFFSDIRGFTKLSEVYTPEQMVAQLNEYFEAMADIIFKYDGTLDKYVGDLIMVLLGVPKPMSDAPERAIRMAIDMQRKLEELNLNWKARGQSEFNVGMGINSGEMIFGNIGSSRAMGITVIGDNVNTAQRLEAFARTGMIVISDATYHLVKGKRVVAHQILY